MKTDIPRFLPEARREGIIIKEFEGEILVYDVERDRAHCLNQLAGKIWRLCDGRSTASEMAAALSHEHGSAVDEKVVRLGLDDLRRSHLLEETKSEPHLSVFGGMPRREAVRRIGLGAAIALPLIASVTAPTAVQAAVSCKPHNANCGAGPECCSGTCNPSGKCVGN